MLKKLNLLLPSVKEIVVLVDRPTVGEIRTIHVEKSAEPLGIMIKAGQEGGIFVSSVSEHSLALKAGIAIGDQILEVSLSIPVVLWGKAPDGCASTSVVPWRHYILQGGL